MMSAGFQEGPYECRGNAGSWEALPGRAKQQVGDFINAVVNVEQGIIVIGGNSSIPRGGDAVGSGLTRLFLPARQQRLDLFLKGR